MIIDFQVHLWPAETPQRPWPKGGAERAHLPYPLTYQMFLGLMDEADVDRCIIVPPSWGATVMTTPSRRQRAIPTASPSWAASR